MFGRFFTFLVLVSSFQVMAADLKPKTTVFMVPKVNESAIDNFFNDNSNGENKEYSIFIPIKQDDGTYKMVEVTYTETDDRRTISIPGQGDISLVKDDNGDYNFELTPEQINDSSNVTCKVGTSGKGNCTITPFVTMIGDKILTADKLVVDYTEGENLIIAGGTATNLKLTDKDSTTNFNKSETDAGDSEIYVSFGKEPGSSTENKTVNVGGIDLPLPTPVTDISVPFKNADKRNMQLSLSTSKLVHSVTNPNNPNDTRTKFQVKDGGVATTLVIDSKDHTKINFNATTQGGVSYNSDPFSDKNVKIETSSVVKGSINIDNDPENPMSSLSIMIDGKNKDGTQSETTIVDTRSGDKKTSITSRGQTIVNISQAGLVNEKTLKPLDKNAPVAFEVGSEFLTVKSEKNDGTVTESTVTGLVATGQMNGNNKNINLSAQNININQSGKSSYSAGAQDLQYVMQETDSSKKQQALLSHAYYNNGQTEANLSNGALISQTEFKDQQTAETFNGKPIRRDSFILGNTVAVKDKDNQMEFSGGIAARQIEFYDKSKITTVSGNQGEVLGKNYGVKLDDGFHFVTEQDGQGKTRYTEVGFNQLTAKQKGNELNVLNSLTTSEVMGKTTSGKDILKITHNSQSIDYKKGDGSQALTSNELQLAVVSADKVKYGSANFKDLTYKNKNSEVKIINAEAAIYVDESDPKNKLRQGEFSLEELNAKATDYSVNIVAKDENGVAGKYKIIFYEDGKNKSYKVFAEDGKRVYFDGVDKDNRHAKLVLETVEYLETEKFRSVMAKNISGSLETVTPNSSKLQTFNIARVAGVESLDGSFRQFSLADGSISQVIPGKDSTHVDFKNVDYLEQTINGKKVTYVKAEGVNGSRVDQKSTTNINGLNLELVDAGLVKYGKASFNQLAYQKGNSKVNVVGAEAVIFTDNTDPSNKIKQGELSLSKLNAKETDYSVDIIAKDANGVEGKYKIVFYEDGKTKNYKIFAEDGQRLYFDGVDKKNRHAKIVMESLEYLETDKFKAVVASNISGSLETVSNDSPKLQTFNIGRVEGVQALDGSYTQLMMENGKISQTDKGNTNNVSFNSVNYTQETQNGVKHTFFDAKGVNVSGSTGKATYSIATADIEYVDAKTVKYGKVKIDHLAYQDGKSQVNVVGAEAVVYTDSTDPTNKIRQGELSLSKLGAKETDYSVDIIAKDANGVEGKYKIVFYEDAQSKSYKIFAEDGRRIYLNGIDKNNQHAKVILESIEYLETPEFKYLLANNISGSLETVSADSKKLQSFNFGRIEGVQSLDGRYVQVSIQNGQLSQMDNGKSANVDFNSLDVVQTNEQGSKTTYANGKGISGNGNTGKGEFSFTNGNIELLDSKTIKYGTANFDNLSYKDGKSEVMIIGAEAAIFSDSSDPTNKMQQGELSLSKLGAKGSEYSFDVVAKDDNGVEGKYKIQFYEDSENKMYKIFAEDGRRVYFNGADKNNQHAQVVLGALDYLETPDVRQVLATNLSGSLESVAPNSKKLQSFNFGKVAAVQSKDGSYMGASIENGSLSQVDGKSKAEFNVKQASFSQTNFLDTKDIKAGLFDGAINYIEYDKKGTKLDANVSFGSVLFNEISSGKNDKITMFSASNIDLVAVDYESLVKLNGQVGGVDFFENSKIQSISITDLKNMRIEDMNSGIVANLNAGEIIRVVNKDAKGNETGSYLLMKSSVLNATDAKNGINANIRVGVLEFMQDKLSGQNIVMEADVSGRVKLDKTKSPITAEINFALKGKNLITENHSYVSPNGDTVSKYFSIKAADSHGHLDKIEFSAGPSFLKEALSLEAKGGKDGGKSLNFTFQQDKTNGTYYVRAEFIEGEKVKVKLFPFTLESKMQGGDALAELMITPKGQNFYNHMQIISSVVSSEEITDWLEVSSGGMIVARTGTLGGFGFEMMYQDEEHFLPQDQIGMSYDKASSIGAGIYHKNAKGDRTSAGILLTGDSEFQYSTNGRGVLKVFGMDMAKDGRIPATVNFYLKKDYADGDAIYGGVFVDTTSYTIDPTKLRKDAAYYDGGRNAGKMGASVGFSKKISDNQRLTISAGANNDFKDPAACITYTMTFGGPKQLASDSMKIVNRLNELKPTYSEPIYSMGPTVSGARSLLYQELNVLEPKNEEAVVVSKLKDAIEEVKIGLDESDLTAERLVKLSQIDKKDLDVLRRVERRRGLNGSYSDDLKFLVDLARRVQDPKSVYEREVLIRSTMEKLTEDFDYYQTADIHNKYLQKVDELAKLNGN